MHQKLQDEGREWVSSPGEVAPASAPVSRSSIKHGLMPQILDTRPDTCPLTAPWTWRVVLHPASSPGFALLFHLLQALE